MQIRHLAGRLEVWAPAKLNLFLEVLGKRADGFHEIETLMCAIGLYDTLAFRTNPAGILELKCHWAVAGGEQNAPGIETLPENSDNTVVRALDLLRQRVGFAG